MSKKPTRRELRFECVQDTIEEVRSLSTSGYARAGNWNLSQACQHLTKTLRMSLEGTSFSVPFFVKPIARWMLFRTVMACKPTRLRAKAPSDFTPQETENIELDNEQDITEYEQMVQAVLADDAQFIPEHPVFGRVTADEWRKFHAWHAAHHLSFLVPKSSAQE